jgi:DNA-binding transcriptional ArsR family regulator
MKFNKNIKEAHWAYKTLSHPIVQKIINTLEKHPHNVTDLRKALNLEQSVTSLFLGKLRKFGFVTFVKDSKVVTYSVNKEQIIKFTKAADGLF